MNRNGPWRRLSLTRTKRPPPLPCVQSLCVPKRTMPVPKGTSQHTMIGLSSQTYATHARKVRLGTPLVGSSKHDAASASQCVTTLFFCRGFGSLLTASRLGSCCGGRCEDARIWRSFGAGLHARACWLSIQQNRIPVVGDLLAHGFVADDLDLGECPLERRDDVGGRCAGAL